MLQHVVYSLDIYLCPNFEQTLIHLIDRKTGKEVGTKYYTGAMVVYHHVNAFEEDGHVVCDVIAYEDNSLYDMFYLSKIKEESGSGSLKKLPSYSRFALPVQSDKVQCNGKIINDNLCPCLVLSMIYLTFIIRLKFKYIQSCKIQSTLKINRDLPLERTTKIKRLH